MYPVAGGTVRMPKKDVVVGGQYVIPKDVTVFLPVSPAACYAQMHKHQPQFSLASLPSGPTVTAKGVTSDSHLDPMRLLYPWQACSD